MTRRHLILVGLPGSGKSTVGRLAAAALGAPFVDLDVDIERRTGSSIAEIFSREGERAFRELELEAARAVLAGPAAVVAPGGGFFAVDVTHTAARGSGLVVYLATGPAEAATRLGAEAAGRPLLAGGAAAHRLAALLAEREAWYGAADCTVETDGRSAEEVAAAVVSLARRRGGW